MSQRASMRATAIVAVVSVVALAAHSMILGSMPKDTGSAATVATYLRDHHDALLASAWLDGIGSILLIVFVWSLVALTGTATASFVRQITTRVAGIVIALSLVIDAVLIAAARQAGAGHDDAAVALFGYAHGIDFVFPLANMVWMPALALVLRRQRIVPAVFAPLILLVGILELVVGTAALASERAAAANNLVFMALAVWVLAAGIALAVRSRRAIGSGPADAALPPRQMSHVATV